MENHPPPLEILEQSRQQKTRAHDLVQWAVGTADQSRLATDLAWHTVQRSRRLVAGIHHRPTGRRGP